MEKPILLLCAFLALSAAWEDHPDCGVSRYRDAPGPVSSEGGRVVGGWAVRVNELPWQASIKTLSGLLLCGGTLISPSHVLTAAHCRGTPLDRRVGLGEHNFTTTVGHLRLISSWTNHPNWNPITLQNDIAIVTLFEPAEIDDTVRPICSPERALYHSYAGETLHVSGWGYRDQNGFFAPVLNVVDVEGYSTQQCLNSGYEPGDILDGMMCAGYPEGGKDACQGDSGGPLAFKRGDGLFEQVGVVSWGRGCANPGFPGVYSDVVYYNDWISDVIDN